MAKTVVHVQAGLPRQQTQVAQRLPRELKVKFLPASRRCPKGISRLVVWSRFGGHQMARFARAHGVDRVVEHCGGLTSLVEVIEELGRD